MTPRVLILTVAAVLAVAPFAAAQPEPSYVADLRFVDALRKRGDTALAMDYLQRLGKNPGPELAKELPFELAKTRLAIGAEEPDSSKRLAVYQQARGEFETFLKQNPDSPRAAEARLEIAHVAVLQGKSQLSKALAQDSLQARVSEALTARRMLADAGAQLDKAYADLEAQLQKIPATDKGRRKQLEADLLQAELTRAINLFDQSQTYLNTASDKELVAQIDANDRAADALQKIVDKDSGTISWQATAWLARCQLLGNPVKARESLTKLLSIKVTPTNAVAIADAHRLGLYFLMLLNAKNPEPADKNPAATTIAAAHQWLKSYPRHRNMPEGYGVRFLLAQALIVEADRKGVSPEVKTKSVQEARDVLKELEHSENDFTDEARQLKITLIDKQGGFKAALEQLKTFDDCYLRSQYEIHMIAEDLKGVDDLKQREAKVKARREAAMKALELGLAKPDAKPNAQGKYSYEVNNARLALAYHYLTNGNNKEAIKIAEELARQDVRASQAPTAAAYAVQAYAQNLAEREQKVASKDELKPDRDKLLAFAKFAEEVWPDQLPANLSRHQVGLMQLRDKQLAEAIKTLNTVTPSYPNYALVKYQIADACIAAEKAKVEPLKDLGSYSDLALQALMSIPDSALLSADPDNTKVFFLSKIRIGQELFKAKRFDDMEILVTPLLSQVKTATFALDGKRNTQLRDDIALSLNEILVFAKYGKADAAFKEKNYTKVMELLGPVITEINDGKQPQLKNNPTFWTALLSLALKATIQSDKLDQTKPVLAAMQKAGGDTNGSANTLLQLVEPIQNQLDEKKNDLEALTKTKNAFKRILDEIDTAQTMKTMDFNYLLARNYSALDLHEKAADILERVELPAKTGMKEADDKNERVYHTAYVAYIHELRLSGGNNKDKAAQLLDKIIGTAKEPGWGLANVDANLERVLLWEEDGKFALAAKLADQWVNKLKAKADSDVQVREKYLEFYYHTSYCFYKHGMGLKDKAKGDKYVKEAATQLMQLEKTWKGFGSEASTKRIQALLDKEPELKTQYEALKK